MHQRGVQANLEPRAAAGRHARWYTIELRSLRTDWRDIVIMWGKKENEQTGKISPLAATKPRPDAGRGGPGMAQSERGASLKRSQIGQRPTEARRTASSVLGRALFFEGEIQSDEDLIIDGSVKGRVVVPKNSLSIGPTSSVEAEVNCRELTLHGKLKGNAQAIERIRIKKTGTLEGEMTTHRLAIEDGGVFRGMCDIKIPEQPAKPKEPKAEARRVPTAAKPLPRPRPPAVPVSKT